MYFILRHSQFPLGRQGKNRRERKPYDRDKNQNRPENNYKFFVFNLFFHILSTPFALSLIK
jgi:hypothetical protein